MKKIDGGTCTHVGILVNNIDDALGNLALFVDNFSRVDKVYPPSDVDPKTLNLRYQGREVYFQSKITAVQLGGMTLEFFEPLEGESSWHDMLKEKGSCLHHIFFDVESINDTIELFKSEGIKCLQRGGTKDGRAWAYFDTIDKLGYHIEVTASMTNEEMIEE